MFYSNCSTSSWIKGFWFCLMIMVFGLNIIIGAFNLGAMKNHRHMAFVSLGQDCNVMAGKQDFLEQIWNDEQAKQDAKVEAPAKEVKLSKK